APLSSQLSLCAVMAMRQQRRLRLRLQRQHRLRRLRLRLPKRHRRHRLRRPRRHRPKQRHRLLRFSRCKLQLKLHGRLGGVGGALLATRSCLPIGLSRMLRIT
ncbi:hypothetical protein GGI05_003998, partial [Coemansia sp. RSA 2603]